MSPAGDCQLPAGCRVIAAVAGGDINRAFKVQLADGRLAFVKTRTDARAGEFEAEAQGLRWLAEADAIPIPEVIDVAERYLALQWIEPGALSDAGQQGFGCGLAELHAAGAWQFGEPAVGPEGRADTHKAAGRRPGSSGFGSLALSNEPAESWPDFYVQRRLLPMTELAFDKAAISAECVGMLEGICSRIDELAGPDEPPSRLHGDLWQGNVLADQSGNAWLVDPSAYGGHREMDLAMLHLFGRPSERMLDAYQERHPLAAGWQQRLPLWQLAPLLVHAVLFGGHYGDAVMRAAASAQQ